MSLPIVNTSQAGAVTSTPTGDSSGAQTPERTGSKRSRSPSLAGGSNLPPPMDGEHAAQYRRSGGPKQRASVDSLRQRMQAAGGAEPTQAHGSHAPSGSVASTRPSLDQPSMLEGEQSTALASFGGVQLPEQTQDHIVEVTGAGLGEQVNEAPGDLSLPGDIEHFSIDEGDGSATTPAESWGQCMARWSRSAGVLLLRTSVAVGPATWLRQLAITGIEARFLASALSPQARLGVAVTVAAVPMLANLAGGIVDEFHHRATARTRTARAINMLGGLAAISATGNTGTAAQKPAQMLGILVFSAMRDSLQLLLQIKDQAGNTSVLANLISAGVYAGAQDGVGTAMTLWAGKSGIGGADMFSAGSTMGDHGKRTILNVAGEFLDDLTRLILQAVFSGKPFDVKLVVAQMKPSWEGGAELVQDIMNRTNYLNTAVLFSTFADRTLGLLDKDKRELLMEPLNRALEPVKNAQQVAATQAGLGSASLGALYTSFTDQQSARQPAESSDRREPQQHDDNPSV